MPTAFDKAQPIIEAYRDDADHGRFECWLAHVLATRPDMTVLDCLRAAESGARHWGLDAVSNPEDREGLVLQLYLTREEWRHRGFLPKDTFSRQGHLHEDQVEHLSAGADDPEWDPRHDFNPLPAAPFRFHSLDRNFAPEVTARLNPHQLMLLADIPQLCSGMRLIEPPLMLPFPVNEEERDYLLEESVISLYSDLPRTELFGVILQGLAEILAGAPEPKLTRRELELVAYLVGRRVDQRWSGFLPRWLARRLNPVSRREWPLELRWGLVLELIDALERLLRGLPRP